MSKKMTPRQARRIELLTLKVSGKIQHIVRSFVDEHMSVIPPQELVKLYDLAVIAWNATRFALKYNLASKALDNSIQLDIMKKYPQKITKTLFSVAVLMADRFKTEWPADLRIITDYDLSIDGDRVRLDVTSIPI